MTAESKQTLNFAFVGFYNEKNVDVAVQKYGQNNKIGGKIVTVSPVHTWMLDLYPLRAPGFDILIIYVLWYNNILLFERTYA